MEGELIARGEDSKSPLLGSTVGTFLLFKNSWGSHWDGVLT